MQDTSYELLTIFRDGGFMMIPLVLCSLVALGVILAKGWTLLVAHLDSQKLLDHIEELGTRAGSMRPCRRLATRAVRWRPFSFRA